MEFDLNLIVVPVTLLFLLVFLLDKFFLKQHKLAKGHNRQISLAETHLAACKKALSASLKKHYGTKEVERFTPSASTPADVTVLHDNYQTAKRKLTDAKEAKKSVNEFFLVAWAYEWLPVLLFIVILQGFVVRQFNIPSSSMVPTLYTGDFILVNPSAYGLRLPLLNTKLIPTGTPKNGDVVVFRYPLNENRYYIKRVVGIAGDTVRYDHGRLSINGKEVATVSTNYQMDNQLIGYLYPKEIFGRTLSSEEQQQIGQLEEGLASYQQEKLGEHSYHVRYLKGANTNESAEFLRQTAQGFEQNGQVWEIKIPDNEYFVMGDNRDRSEDSRFWGFVHDRHLVGKANYIWMHKQPGLNAPSFERTGNIN